MTLPWILDQIEETISEKNSRQAVYDLAMLVICRDEFVRRAAPVHVQHTTHAPVEHGYSQAASEAEARGDDKMTLKDIEREMKYLEAEPFSMDAARDFAALCIIHDHMTNQQGLGSTPTLEQVEKALGVVAINSEADMRKAEDMRSWARIISQGKR